MQIVKNIEKYKTSTTGFCILLSAPFARKDLDILLSQFFALGHHLVQQLEKVGTSAFLFGRSSTCWLRLRSAENGTFAIFRGVIFAVAFGQKDAKSFPLPILSTSAK